MGHDDRLTELESRIAHQEHSIQTLSEEIFAQQKKIEALETRCEYLLEQFRTHSLQTGPDKQQDEVPPHY